MLSDEQPLKKEGALIQKRIEADKSIIKADFQKLQYTIIGSLLKEILGLFSSKKKAKTRTAEKPEASAKPKASASKSRAKKEKG